MDRAQDRSVARREPDRRHSARPAVEGPGDHRRAGRGQDDHRQCHPAHPGGEGCEPTALRTDWPRRQTDDGSHRVRSQDHSPIAGGRSQGRRFQTQWRPPTRVRPVGRRRNVDGRYPADAGTAEGGPRPCGAADRRRHRSASLCRARAGPGRRDRVRLSAGCAVDRNLPSGRAEPDHHQRPPHQSGIDSRSIQARRGQRLLLCAGGRSRRSPCRGSSNW